MLSKRISIGKIVAEALVLLLLCGIVAGEFPELLCLTDNTANDFTVRRIDPVVSPSLLVASSHVRQASNTYTPELLFLSASPFEKTVLIPSGAFILHSILRT
jgi:hypothetical protein